MINKTQYINNLYNNSQQLLSAIDHKHKDFNGAIETKAITEYKTFLKERHKNPTMTAIIMNETLNQNPIKNNNRLSLIKPDTSVSLQYAKVKITKPLYRLPNCLYNGFIFISAYIKAIFLATCY